MRWHAGRVGQLRWVVAALGALVVAIPASAQAAPAWQAGATQESSITDCIDQQMEPGASVTPSVYEDYSNPPAAGATYYIEVTAYGIGDSCSGEAADVTVQLPAGTTPQISAATPVICYPLGPNASGTQVVNGPPDHSGACPQTAAPLGSNTYRFDMAQNTGFDSGPLYPAWALPVGYGVQIWIPIVSSAQISTPTPVTADVQILDGQSDPTLDPSVDVLVGPAGTQPSPTGDAESVIEPTVTNLTSTTATISATFVYNYSNSGDPEIGYGHTAPSPNYYYIESFGYLFTTAPYQITASIPLTGLGAGCTYHWAGIMLNPSPQTIDGATGDQTFTTPGSGGNCTAAPTQGSPGAPQIYKRAPLSPGANLPPNGLTPAKLATKKPTTPTIPTPHTTPVVLTPAAFTNLQLPAVQRGTLLKLQLVIGLANSNVEADVLLPAVTRGKHRHKQVLLGKLVERRVRAGKLILKIRLNSAGRRLLHQHRSLRLSLKLIVTPPGGKPVVVTKPFTLRR